VAERLIRVNARLRPFDAEIFVVDAYRPIRCQAGLWEFFWAQARREMPEATREEQENYVRNFVSDPTRFAREDSRTWPVHSSGGAVDVILRRADTRETLDLGARFDEMSPDSYSDALERKLAAGEIAADDPRLLNRRLLHWAMAEEGFVNYPFEFWHFDYGDQMYVLHARLLGLPAPDAAWYGYVDPPDED
jgi:D-alanyl-D-alanine dipeptidase